jgi:WD40 repeat protein
MAVAISPDGKRVISGGASASGSGVVHLFDTATGAPVWSVDDHAAEVLAVVSTPDGSSLATGSADGFVKLRDPQTGSVMRTLAGHQGGATSIALSPDGAMLVCGEGQGGTRVWDTRTGRLLHTCKAADSRASAVTTDRLFTSVAFTPDGTMFLECTASVGNTYSEPARLWDIRTGKLVRELGGGRPIALSPDGSIVAAGGKSVSLRDIRTGEELHRLTGHLKKTQSIAFSPDGRLIYAGGSYGTTNIWEVATGRHLVTLFAFHENREGAVADDWLAYHPDGRYDGSPGVERYLVWRVGDELQTPEILAPKLHRPERIESRF